MLYTTHRILLMILIYLILGLWAINSHADIDNKRAINAIIGEAEGEGYQGMLAIAGAIRNRGTLKGVYGEKSARVVGKKYNAKTYQLALKAWKESASNDITHGADHWASLKIDYAWEHKMRSLGFVKTYEYKNHAFYRQGRNEI